MTISRRNLLTLGAAAAVVGSTGCIGSFGAFNTLLSWNQGLSNKWVNWLVFLVLMIIPVYGLFFLGDLLIFNTIEFFTGSNPLGSATRDLGNGHTVAYERDKSDPNLVRVEHRHDGKVAGVFFIKKSDNDFLLYDQDRKLLTHAMEHNGGVKLLDGRGKVIVELSAAELQAMTKRVEKTGAVVASVEETLGHERVLVASGRGSVRM